MPVVEPMVATAVLLLLHMQPDALSVSVVVPPTQMVVLPRIGGLIIVVVTASTKFPPFVRPPML
jgi:hypothetical protein